MAERTRTPLRETSAWRRLEWHLADVRHADLRELFAGDPTRGERLLGEAAGLYLDYSKQLLTDETLELLRKLAAERKLRERAADLLATKPSEDVNAALHVALRMPRSRSVVVDGVDVVQEAHAELRRMFEIAERVRAGSWLGATGERIRAVVTVAARGSDLGPALAYEALDLKASSELDCRFVSDLDPVALATALEGLDPAETLLIVVAREMDEPAALANAAGAVAWLESSLGGDGPLEQHLLVVTARAGSASVLGVAPESVLRLPDWLEESRSLCSPAGVSVCIALGADGFRELLAGFSAMDGHFATAALGGNLPVIAGLIAVWYRNFLGLDTAGVIPYGKALRLLPAYVRQLTLRSGGKSVAASGEPAEVETAPLVWGGTGTSAQGAVFQFLQQGTLVSPVDLVVVARAPGNETERHDLLAANAFAQAEALAFGRTLEELEDVGVDPETIPHRVLPGNRPSSVVLVRSLTPETLGSLLAFYEHSAFTQASIWGVDPFGECAVEYSDELAARIAPELGAGWKRELMHDSSTNALIRRYRRLRDARR